MRVSEIMTRDVVCCNPDTTLREIGRLMVELDCGAIPVCEGRGSKRLVGMVTDRDIAIRAVAVNRDALSMQAHEIMSTPIATIEEGASVLECILSMEQHMVRRLPVANDMGEVIGMVSQSDIARHVEDMHVAGFMHRISKPKPTLRYLSQPHHGSQRIGI